MSRFRHAGKIIKLLDKKKNIRDIGIIAHIDHGKTTMTDSLLAEAGLLSPKIAGEARALDYLEATALPGFVNQLDELDSSMGKKDGIG